MFYLLYPHISFHSLQILAFSQIFFGGGGGVAYLSTETIIVVVHSWGDLLILHECSLQKKNVVFCLCSINYETEYGSWL